MRVLGLRCACGNLPKSCNQFALFQKQFATGACFSFVNLVYNPRGGRKLPWRHTDSKHKGSTNLRGCVVGACRLHEVVLSMTTFRTVKGLRLQGIEKEA